MVKGMEFPRLSRLAEQPWGKTPDLSEPQLPLCKMEIIIEPISNYCPSIGDWITKEYGTS